MSSQMKRCMGGGTRAGTSIASVYSPVHQCPEFSLFFVLNKCFLAQALLAKSLVISDQLHLQSLSLPQGFAGESKISNL